MAQTQKRPQRTGLYIGGRFDNIEKKRNFIQAAARIKFSIYGDNEKDLGIDQARMWVNAIRKLCEVQSVTISAPFYRYMSPKQLMVATNRIGAILSELESEIRINEAIINDFNYIELDENWKSRAGSYISHIRDVVSKADVSEAIREKIFKRLNQLQEEIDRNRTHVESITEVFLAITEAVSKGAKHLDGAVKLVERLAGALSGARTAKIEHDTQLRLPAPDNLGLSDPE